jgi:soluble calcium-activated nucleotidase 1
MVFSVLSSWRRFPVITIVFPTLLFTIIVLTASHSRDSKGRYPFQQSYWKYDKDSEVYDIAIISDMDKDSKEGDHWKSLLKQGRLTRSPTTGLYSVEWLPQEILLTSKLNEGGRGMELSELCYYNNKLFSVDDRTGAVFVIQGEKAVAEYILADGDGTDEKGFKAEWMTVKDGLLYVGSMGKEWIQNGVATSSGALWVKTIDREGRIKHIDWSDNYSQMRKATGTEYPGYLLHEAVSWNPVEKKWYFFPRRVSTEAYDPDLDEERCGNIAISADPSFTQFKVIHEVGPFDKTRGFASSKFIPFREHEVLVLKTKEQTLTESFMMVYDLKTGKVLMPETKIGEIKFEGVEFL